MIKKIFYGFPIIPILFFACPVGAVEQNLETAIFAGGCFWCLEGPFETLDGVVSVSAGYTGGNKPAPSYAEVSSGETGHFEAIRISYDPKKISYNQLLDVFWQQIDPTDAGGQFVDRGEQYRSAIFYRNEAQHHQAEASKKALDESKVLPAAVQTLILPAKIFYLAEEYHQDYHTKNPSEYARYRQGSGREICLVKLWRKKKDDSLKTPSAAFKKPSPKELRQRLTEMQCHVTQDNGTEPPFANAYWDNKEDGIYVDVVSGEPLFSSKDKYDSGTGWPSFTKPLEPENIIEREDRILWKRRVEVRSRKGDSHLGHVFTDGPGPTKLRYCMNSAALRFVPVKDLDEQGYSQYKEMFEPGK